MTELQTIAEVWETYERRYLHNVHKDERAVMCRMYYIGAGAAMAAVHQAIQLPAGIRGARIFDLHQEVAAWVNAEAASLSKEMEP